MKITKRLLFLSLPAVILFCSSAMGFYGGMVYSRWVATGILRSVEQTKQLIGEKKHEQSLASVIRMFEPDLQRTSAQTFTEPGKVLATMDNIIWAPPNVPVPFLGSLPRPGTYLNTTINSNFCRNVREIACSKPKGVIRIFLVGGSTAFGSGAPSQDRTISGYLERQLNSVNNTGQHYEVFTLANPSWASTHERIAIENIVAELDPDLVISFTGFNDVMFGWNGHNIMLFRNHYEEYYWTVYLMLYGMCSPEPLFDVTSLVKHTALNKVVERFVRNHAASGDVLARIKVPYWVCLQPSTLTSQKKLTAREAGFKHRKDANLIDYYCRAHTAFIEALQSVAGNKMRILNVSTIFDPMTADVEIFLDSSHFGDRGNEIIGKYLAEQCMAHFGR